LNHHDHGGKNHTEWDCLRKWPSLSLFVPFKVIQKHGDSRYYEIEATFLRSLSLFWPLKLSNTSVMLIYDSEDLEHPYVKMIRDTVNNDYIGRVPGGISVTGIPKMPFYDKGYDRQQYNMFWADNFTTSEFIGFGDTDTAFTTYVDREDLWEDGKPVFNGRSGYVPTTEEYASLRYYTVGTLRVLKVLEPFYAMSYFPVIVKTAHLALMRNHINKLHNQTCFDETFRDVILAGSKYQFGIMMTYLWYNHRDEYVW
jgi:hypothetical protein